jgi:alpha-tubulin suppressor-like RCC1 family protein
VLSSTRTVLLKGPMSHPHCLGWVLACGALVGFGCGNEGTGLGVAMGAPGPGGSLATADRSSMRPLTGVTQVSASASHYCALLRDGTVRCSGSSERGGVDGSSLTQPGPLPGVRGAVRVMTDTNHSCILLAAGTVQCWGSNQVGQLGDGGVEDSLVPVNVANIDSARALAVGGATACAALDDGTVWCWGGDHGAVPERIVGITTATDVSVGLRHECGLLSERRVRCWGDNSSGQLGREGPDSDTAVDVLGIDDAVALSVHGFVSCVVRLSGEVWCWGQAQYLGEEATEDSPLPVQIQGIPPAIAVSAGGDVICVLTADGAVWCWGLGRGEGFASIGQVLPRKPAQRTDVSRAVAIDSGTLTVCAVLDDTTAKCSSDRLGWSFTLLEAN